MDIQALSKLAYAAHQQHRVKEEEEKQQKTRENHQVRLNHQEDILRDFFGDEMWQSLNSRTYWDDRRSSTFKEEGRRKREEG